MRNVNCSVCGADDYFILFPRGFAQLHQIVKCKQCGMMYANPQELVDCVRFEAEDYPKTLDPELNRFYMQKQFVQLPDNERALAVLNKHFPQRGKLLEIGSFMGIFLDRIRAGGWDVTGLEPDHGAAVYSREKYGLNIVEGLLTTVEFPEAAFDAVVMLHVIEHMPDPNVDLQIIRRILKPGGMLAVETPRFDSLSFKLLKHRERSVQNCNGHVSFFTVPTLRRLLEKNGFEVVRVELVGRTMTLERLLMNVGLVSRNQRIKAWLSRLSTALHLDRARIYINLRDMQRIYCKRK